MERGPTESESDVVQQNTIEAVAQNIEDVALGKVLDVLEYGTAHSALVPTLEKIEKKEGEIGFTHITFTGEPDNTKNFQFTALSELNIREYLDQSLFTSSIKDVLLFGIQSDSRIDLGTPKAEDIGTKTTRHGYSTKMIAKTADEYKKKISDVEEEHSKGERSFVPQNIYFNVIGRNMDQRHRTGMPKSVDDYEYSENQFATPWSIGGVSVVFQSPDVAKEEAIDTGIDKPVKFGSFRLGNGYSRFEWNRLKQQYPDLKPNDLRILEVANEQIKEKMLGGEVSQYERMVRGSLHSDYVNEKGHMLGDGDFGFLLRLRVPPRKIKGLVVTIDPDHPGDIVGNSLFTEDVTDSENVTDDVLFSKFGEVYALSQKKREEWKSVHYSHLVQRLIKIMHEIGENDPDKVVPIYDYKGNMLWPKQMTHEEIERMKEEGARDASI